MSEASGFQILPAIDWALDTFGGRVFLAGSDYVFPRTAAAIVGDYMRGKGEIVGEEFVALDSADVHAIVDGIKSTRPDVVLNLINGETNRVFFEELSAAGLGPDAVPVISFSIGEEEIRLTKRNYGWPEVSFGRNYSGDRITNHPTREGIEQPLLVWLPAIAAAGMAIYSGDQFPAWRGNLLVGSLRQGGIPGSGHLERIVYNELTQELRREPMLTELRQRIREVREGPDGLLYLLTAEDDGALLRIEPAP